jgi:hypothetical protein
MCDEIIVFDKEDVKKALRAITAKGIALYRPLIEKHLAIDPEEAVSNVSLRIRQIIEAKELYDPEGRLLELALFWAWLGYGRKGLNTLGLVDPAGNRTAVMNAMAKLITSKADREDLVFLKKWAGHGYREWILQSLWIKLLYITHTKIDGSDKAWLGDFPPATNIDYFLPFSNMWEECLAGTSGADWRLRARSMAKDAAFMCGL